MLKICTVALLAIFLSPMAASAHGGGGAEPMPATNFTDMPPFSPQRLAPVRRMKAKYMRWQQGSLRGR